MNEVEAIRKNSILGNSIGITRTPQPHKNTFIRNQLSKDGDEKLTAIRTQAMAAKYRLNQNTKQQVFTKVMRVKTLNALHAAGAFKDPDEEETRSSKTSAQTKRPDLSIDDLDSYDFDYDDDVDDGNDVDENQKLYEDACRQYKAKFMKIIYNQLVAEKLSLLSVVLKRTDSKALATALLKNMMVEELILDNNDIGSRASCYFADVISRNNFLVDVRISENHLGSTGAESICYALRNNNYIRRLNLSGNGFTEDDAHHFKEMLDENHALRELYLGHNEFREKGGEILAEGLATNDFLRVLDLSWNHLRMAGATAIGRALQANRHLEKLDISWNGFHIRGAVTISTALARNSSLTDLNLQSNRLTDPCVAKLLQGLQLNSTLKILNLSKNSLYPISAQRILQCIDQHDHVALDHVDLGEQCVNEKFEEQLSLLQQKRKIKFIHGMVWKTNREVLGSLDDDEDENTLINEDPLLVLMEFARLSEFSLEELVMTLDRDGNGSLSREEFILGLESKNIPMRRRALTKLIDKLDIDGDGEISLEELERAKAEHDAKLALHMRGDVPMEQTEIGRIDKHLRVIMHQKRTKRK